MFRDARLFAKNGAPLFLAILSLIRCCAQAVWPATDVKTAMTVRAKITFAKFFIDIIVLLPKTSGIEFLRFIPQSRSWMPTALAFFTGKIKIFGSTIVSFSHTCIERQVEQMESR